MLDRSGPGHDERVEILLCLDAVDPLAGRLRMVPAPGAVADPRSPSGEGDEVRFTGWLGLLRVLYEAMGSPAAATRDTEES